MTYNGSTSVVNSSVFNPDQLTEEHSLYFWIADYFLDPLMTAMYNDGRFVLNISGEELTVCLSICGI